jgi:uncharacterized cupredoxin-like copper-binding protein
MTQKTVPASSASTTRVTGIPTKKEVDRIAVVRTIRRTMKSLDEGDETKMKLEDVNMNVAKTKTKNGIESTTNITSGIGGRKTTLVNEEKTTAAIKSGIVTVGVEAKARMACMCLLL